jgi:hypothetical protein
MQQQQPQTSSEISQAGASAMRGHFGLVSCIFVDASSSSNLKSTSDSDCDCECASPSHEYGVVAIDIEAKPKTRKGR